MNLVGDIGGTKTILALYQQNSANELILQSEQTYINAEYDQFDDILEVFLTPSQSICSACFGIAGPIVNQRCQATNLPWVIDAAYLQAKLHTPHVKLLNDLEAMAIGMLHLEKSDYIELNPNATSQPGNIAVIAAGTGLGEAILYWDGEHHHPIATEGGHSDFATQSRQQDRLLQFLRRRFTHHVSWERVLSGDGFGALYDFLLESNFAPPCPIVPADDSKSSYHNDRNAIISRLGLNREDPLCVEALRLFVRLYGAEAGNLALKCFASGGVYIGGGIAPKILSAMQNGDFLDAFLAKGRFQTLLNTIPIRLSLNPNTPILGAAHYFSDRNIL